MNKYEVEIVGKKKYIANSYDDARKMAIKDTESIHYLWDVKIDTLTNLGKVNQEQ